MRIWLKNGHEPRNPEAKTATAGGDLVQSGVILPASALGFSANTTTAVVYVEGIRNSQALGDTLITLSGWKQEPAAGAQGEMEDIVRVTVGSIYSGLDVDRDGVVRLDVTDMSDPEPVGPLSPADMERPEIVGAFLSEATRRYRFWTNEDSDALIDHEWTSLKNYWPAFNCYNATYPDESFSDGPQEGDRWETIVTTYRELEDFVRVKLVLPHFVTAENAHRFELVVEENGSSGSTPLAFSFIDESFVQDTSYLSEQAFGPEPLNLHTSNLSGGESVAELFSRNGGFSRSRTFLFTCHGHFDGKLSFKLIDGGSGLSTERREASSHDQHVIFEPIDRF